MDAAARAQERIVADQMLQDDLRRARQIRQAALDAILGPASAAQPVEMTSPPRRNIYSPSKASPARMSPSRRHVATDFGMMRSPSPTFHAATSPQAFVPGLSPSPARRRSSAAAAAISDTLLEENKNLRKKLNVKSAEAVDLQQRATSLMERVREKDRENTLLENRVQHHEREIQSQELRLAESEAHATKLHEMASLVREEDDVLRQENALLQERVSALRGDINRSEAAVDTARIQCEQLETDCEFRLNIAEENKIALEQEIENSKDELRSFALELQACEQKIESKNEDVTKLQASMARLEEENSRMMQKAKDWHDESERLRRLIDEKNRLHFELKGEGDSQLKQLKIRLHETQAQLAGMEVDKNMLAAAKLDLTHEVSRLNRRAEEREEQVKRLLRIIEEKDQTIAEMGPAMREAKRAGAQARSLNLRKSQRNGWRS